MKSLSILLLLCCLSSTIFAHHECKHDKLEPTSIRAFEFPEGRSANSENGDRVLADTYESIRIHADFTNLKKGNSVVREYIQNQLMASAISYYENTLKVVRYSGFLKITPDTYGDTTCGGLTPDKSLVTTGVEKDLIILVTAEYSTEAYLAYATPCAISPDRNRPVYGMISFNLRLLDTATNVDLQENLVTTMHEIVHVLGFSATLYPYYIDPVTLKRKDVLGSKKLNDNTVWYLNVEPLTTRLRTYFGCSTLEGAYLENQGSSGSALSHWERKTFFNEFMTASAIPDAVISEFTLALLEGTGWYQPDYTMAENFRWGQGKGCNFLNKICVNSANFAASAMPEFCSVLESEGCSFTGRSVGVCGTTDASTPYSSVPSGFNYWKNKTKVLDSFADNCPYYVPYPNLDCEQPGDKEYAILPSAETYGVGSRCLSGTLSPTSLARRTTGYCFAMNCESTGTDTYSLTVKVGSQSVPCTKAGQVTVKGYAGVLNCPDPSEYCKRATPQRCYRGCSGHGDCVDGKCECATGWGGPDCGLRIYEDNCSLCRGQTENKDCFGDSCSCNPDTKICLSKQLIGEGDGGINKYLEGDDLSGSRLSGVFGIVGLIMSLMLLI